MPKKTKPDNAIDAIDKAIAVVKQIHVKGYGWTIEAGVAGIIADLLQIRGLIKMGTK